MTAHRAHHHGSLALADRVPLAQLALAALAVLAVGCGRGDGDTRPDIVLVVIDTLRADRLGAYGNERGLTPNLDRLARESAVFERGSAHAPWTLPSFATLFTSQPPPQHEAGGGLRGNVADFRLLGEQAETLAETLGRAGYATGLVGNVAFLGPDFGLQQGFEQIDVVAFQSNRELRDARATTDAALAWFRDTPAPRFLVVHYFDPHAVYAPPAEYRERFAAPEDRDGEFVFGTRQDLALLRRAELRLDQATVRRAEQLYDGEVAFVDDQIGRLLEGFADSQQAANERFLVLTSDHGEEFLDHGGFEHGHTLYQELLHVPLFIAGPGIAPRRIATPVGHIDVAPTICELAALSPPDSFRGRSLARPLRNGEDLQPRGILAEGNMWGPARTSWRHGAWKLIRPSTSSETAELYDLDNDPHERRNLAASNWERYDELEDDLSAVLLMLERGPGETAPLSADVLDSLEELGYLGQGNLSEAPDPGSGEQR